ncbi:MAG: hypothetical protein Q9M91_01905 [Candidatus Dojkabacteria bacterium]|nr:hypothetical protein [Candidatus Dojkabacteria bacterium]MDQ7020578.1 hypothetical protein [Candidatus Dojkabacteria bacterium]
MGLNHIEELESGNIEEIKVDEDTHVLLSVLEEFSFYFNSLKRLSVGIPFPDIGSDPNVREDLITIVEDEKLNQIEKLNLIESRLGIDISSALALSMSLKEVPTSMPQEEVKKAISEGNLLRVMGEYINLDVFPLNLVYENYETIIPQSYSEGFVYQLHLPVALRENRRERMEVFKGILRELIEFEPILDSIPAAKKAGGFPLVIGLSTTEEMIKFLTTSGFTNGYIRRPKLFSEEGEYPIVLIDIKSMIDFAK